MKAKLVKESIESTNFSEEINNAIDDIVTYATLPPQIDYTLPYKIKYDKAIKFLESLKDGKRYMKIAEKRINAYYESGAAYYDSLF